MFSHKYEIKCKSCNDIVFSSFANEEVSCSCGKVIIEENRERCRYLGDFKNMEVTKI